MLIVIFFSLICLFLTYLETSKKIPHGMFWGFLGITFLYCIHYDFGTDYMQYYQDYLLVATSSYSIDDVFILDNWRNGEFGWGLLQWCCVQVAGRDGFFLLVVINSVIENIIIYRFIRKYANRNCWVFSVFIYLFTSTFYLLGFSMMRQWLAMCIILYAYDFILRKKIIHSLLLIYIASTIHHTASILLPVAFVSYLPMKFAKYYGLFFLGLFMLLLLEGDFLNDTIGLMMLQSDTIEDYVNNYENFDANKTFGIGFLVNLIPFALSLLYLVKNNDDSKKTLIFLSCIGTMLIPFSQSLAMVKRMSLYFTLFSISAVPIVYSAITKKEIRMLLVVLFLFMQIVGYWGFLNDPSYQPHYLVFKTIFSQL